MRNSHDVDHTLGPPVGPEVERHEWVKPVFTEGERSVQSLGLNVSCGDVAMRMRKVAGYEGLMALGRFQAKEVVGGNDVVRQGPEVDGIVRRRRSRLGSGSPSLNFVIIDSVRSLLVGRETMNSLNWGIVVLFSSSFGVSSAVGSSSSFGMGVEPPSSSMAA